jgi:hypothetical protein
MPGVRDLEAHLLLDTHGGDKELRAFHVLCGAVLFDLFEIKRADTEYRPPLSYFDGTMTEEAKEEEDDQFQENESQYFAEKLPWDEQKVEYLKALGWDLTGDNGQPLGITRHVCRVIEAVAKGLAGKAPEADVLDAKRWAEDMEVAAKQFQQKKRGVKL